MPIMASSQPIAMPFLGSVFGRTDFSRGLLFWGHRIFSRILSRICSPHFCGKKCPEKSSMKIPGKILQNLYNKNPRHISAEGQLPCHSRICLERASRPLDVVLIVAVFCQLACDPLHLCLICFAERQLYVFILTGSSCKPGTMQFFRERKTHKHKQICGIVPGLGGWRNFVYVFFSGHSLWGRKNT